MAFLWQLIMKESKLSSARPFLETSKVKSGKLCQQALTIIDIIADCVEFIKCDLVLIQQRYDSLYPLH